MKNILWITAIVLAFLAGYFIHGERREISINPNPAKMTEIIDSGFHQNIDKSIHTESRIALPKVTNNVIANSSSSFSTRSSIPQNSVINDESKPATPEHQHETNRTPLNKPLPKPFDDMLDKVDGSLREKYKDYAKEDQKDDWDMSMQSKITDFILSRPATTDIKIDSINCNSNICEIRIEEKKRFLAMATFAELLQEPWVINTSTGQFNFNESYGYMLLTRK